jgi:hypothetical protein
MKPYLALDLVGLGFALFDAPLVGEDDDLEARPV